MVTETRSRLLCEYINALLSFFAGIQTERIKRGMIWSDDDRLPWSDILTRKNGFPLPTLSEYFGESFPSVLERDQQSATVVREIINRLNETEDVSVWKRGINRLLQIVQGKAYRPFYPGDDYRPELSLEEEPDEVIVVDA